MTGSSDASPQKAPGAVPAAPIESVLRTEELAARPARAPDHAAENRALVALAQTLVDSPRLVLQKLVDVAVEICRAGSAGVSLIDAESGDFYWPALSGSMSPHVGGGTPRDFGPCGVVLDADAVQLFRRPERYYPYLELLTPRVEEALLAPFHVDGKAVGTVWVVSHDPERRFDAEDERLIVSLARFASSAYRTVESLDGLARERKALAESEARLRQVLGAANMGTWRADLRTGRTMGDDNLARILGLNRDGPEARIEDPFRLVHPDDRAAVLAAWDRAVRMGRQYEAEFRVVRDDGSVRWLREHGRVVSGEHATPVAVDGLTLDVTDRRRTQDVMMSDLADTRRLQELGSQLITDDAQALYERILDVALAITQADFASIQRFHPERGVAGELHLLGFRGFDAAAAAFWEWVHPQSTGTCAAALRDRARTVAPDVEECPDMVGTDDLAVYRRLGIRAIQTTPLVSRSGGLVGMISTHWRVPREPSARDLRMLDVLARQAADLLERSHSERALRESEERYRCLVETTAAIVWRADADGRVLEAPRWSDFTGQTPDEMRGWGWLDVVHPDDRADTLRTWEEGRRAKKAAFLEHRLRTRRGRYRWVQVGATPLLDGDGRVREWVGTVTDIDDQKCGEAEREALLSIAERARSDAEAANRAKDEFLAVLSHELRSPMNAMVGWLRILKSTGVRDPDVVARAVDTLERNVWVQAQVINDLLDVSRILSGKLQLDRERLDFDAVVRDCVESARPSAEGKRIALRLEDGASDLDIMGDGARLQQVVSNLVGNAIKFTDEGGSVTVSLDRVDGAARLVVEDTGQGIAPEFLPHLFERFRQADSSSTRRHGGLGLGLSIVKNLVALHGGTVEAESPGVGRGARFTITLPLAGARQAASVPTPSAPSEEGDLDTLDLLLVEDEPDTRHALEMVLAHLGCRVRAAASVHQALEAHAERVPDVLISDIGMPGEDGYVLIRAIREREDGRAHRTLAIAMTGFASRQDREMALRAGFDEHVTKPIDPEVLSERVRVLTASRSRRAPARRQGTISDSDAQ